MDGGYNVYARKKYGLERCTTCISNNMVCLCCRRLTCYRSVATSHMLEILSALRRKLLSAVHTNWFRAGFTTVHEICISLGAVVTLFRFGKQIQNHSRQILMDFWQKNIQMGRFWRAIQKVKDGIYQDTVYRLTSTCRLCLSITYLYIFVVNWLWLGEF